MTDKANHQANLKQARELLSPYLDDEVTAAERALVEQMVEQSPELRRDLETLRQTVSQLSALPPLAAPRPFTLSEADVRPVEPSTPWWNIFSQPWLGALTGAAVALLCVVIAGALFFGGAFGVGSSAPVADVAMQEEAAPAEEEPAAEEAAPAELETPAADTALEAAKQPTPPPPEVQALEAPAEEDASATELAVESAPAEEEATVVEKETKETIDEMEGEAVEEEAAEVELLAAEEAEESADEMDGAAMAESGAEAEEAAEMDEAMTDSAAESETAMGRGGETAANEPAADDTAADAAEADIAPTPSPLATPAPAPEEPTTDGAVPQSAPPEPIQATEPPVETTDQAQAQRQEVTPPATATPLPSPTRLAPTETLETIETIAPDQGGDEALSRPFPRSVVVLVGLVAVVIIAGLLLWGMRRRR